jgi:short chain dehydrogenase
VARTTIVTGSSYGIGRTVALRLARDSFGVVVNSTGNTAKAAEVVNELKAVGGQAIVGQADVANAANVDRLFKETLATFGRIVVSPQKVWRPANQRPRLAAPQAPHQQGHPGGDVGEPLCRKPPARIARAGFRGRRGEGRDGGSPAPRVGRRLQGGRQLRSSRECGPGDGRCREGHEVEDGLLSGQEVPHVDSK